MLRNDFVHHMSYELRSPLANIIGFALPRGLDRALFLELAACDRVAKRRNLLVTGASGLGKTIWPSPMGMRATPGSCAPWRAPNCSSWMTGDPKRSRPIKRAICSKSPRIATIKGSLIITSQVPVDRWHDLIGVPTLADAILDRVIHNACRIDLAGESLRKQRSSP